MTNFLTGDWPKNRCDQMHIEVLFHCATQLKLIMSTPETNSSSQTTEPAENDLDCDDNTAEITRSEPGVKDLNCDICRADGNLPLDQANNICNSHIGIYQRRLLAKQKQNSAKLRTSGIKRPRFVIKPNSRVKRRLFSDDTKAEEQVADPYTLVPCDDCKKKIYANCTADSNGKRLCISCLTEQVVALADIRPELVE